MKFQLKDTVRLVRLLRTVEWWAELVNTRSICILVYLLLQSRLAMQSTSSVQRDLAVSMLEQIRSIRRSWL